MSRKMMWLGGLLSLLGLSAWGANQEQSMQTAPVDASVVKMGDSVPPRVAQPCEPGNCPFAGQRVTVLVANSRLIGRPVLELKDEFEAATGARLNIVYQPNEELFANLISDMTNRTGKYDAVIAGAWWLGELVAGHYIIAYDKYYNDPRFPAWDIEEVLPGPRGLLSYGGKKYMVANDHDGQVMYYRRDLLEDPRHQAAFKQKFGYALAVPTTWEQFRDVAEYFNGRDLNGDGVPDHGLGIGLKPGAQGMFNFMSLSAPFVIGPDNPRLYWFDPKTMKPLIDGPGHVRALEVLVELVRFGPREMLTWDMGKSWDYFLTGRSALTFTWGDLGALSQQEGSKVKGKVGAAPIPGTHDYYNIAQHKWVKTGQPNLVGNTTGGSWAGVISKYSKAPEAAYYLLALMASKEKSQVYAARGWDGIDPGRRFHFLPPSGSGQLDTYLKAGWDEADVRDYLRAYSDNFGNRLQLPYLRVPGTYSYWQALDVHLAEAESGQLSPEAALKAAAVDFEEITLRLGRERQRRAYRTSMGL
ncbi:ABC transporter substrate-binding protein [Cystobacter fuscus]|uniref:ABC transporter substrate-binding protein n=1 Tax=Cystobacter fuscus TaxID=43 RepID=UPI002B315564|nr:extracellular solute-binding protein [Cystobacter fuscus]